MLPANFRLLIGPVDAKISLFFTLVGKGATRNIFFVPLLKRLKKNDNAKKDKVSSS